MIPTLDVLEPRESFAADDVVRVVTAAHDAFIALCLLIDEDTDADEMAEAYEEAMTGLKAALFIGRGETVQ